MPAGLETRSSGLGSQASVISCTEASSWPFFFRSCACASWGIILGQIRSVKLGVEQAGQIPGQVCGRSRPVPSALRQSQIQQVHPKCWALLASFSAITKSLCVQETAWS